MITAYRFVSIKRYESIVGRLFCRHRSTVRENMLCVPTTPNSTCGLVTCHRHILVLCALSHGRHYPLPSALETLGFRPNSTLDNNYWSKGNGFIGKYHLIGFSFMFMDLHLNNDDSTMSALPIIQPILNIRTYKKICVTLYVNPRFVVIINMWNEINTKGL